MRLTIFKLAVASLALAIGIAAFFVQDGFSLLSAKDNKNINSSPRSSQLSLYLSASNTSISVGEAPKVQAAITNNDSETVTLVHPGDGSEVGWRTPVISWSIFDAKKNMPIPEQRLLRCGNQNALQADEVFRLTLGETKQLEWIHLPPFSKPGVYRVVLHYENKPSAEWRGLVMGTHNPEAMWRIRHSTECKIASNEVTFTITK